MFGRIPVPPQSVVEFPRGLPAFEDERRFVLIESATLSPLVVIQSLQRADLAFLAIPATLVDPGFQPELEPADYEALACSPETTGFTCLALVTLPASGPASANLRAPIVINAAALRAVQAIAAASRYSSHCPLPVRGEDVC